MNPTNCLFYLLLIICALNTTHNAVYNQCLLYINQDFQADPYKIKLTLTVYFAAIFLCRCFLGYLSDSCSGHKCILWALAISILGHGMAMLSCNVDMFIAARLFQGLGLGGGQVMGLVILMQIFSSRGRASIVASEQVFFSLASIFLPIMGSLFSRNISWRLTFVVYFVFTCLAFTYFVFFQKPDTNNKPSIELTVNNDKQKKTSILWNKNFMFPTLMACFSISSYILWGSYFSLLIHHYDIPLPYLLMYQLIPIVPYFACSLLFKKLTKNISKRRLYHRILSLQIATFGAIFLLIFWNKTTVSFKFMLLIPIVLHNLAGSFFRPLMQEKALCSVPNNRIGIASSFISICQVGINAIFSIIINSNNQFIITFVCIQTFISVAIITYLGYQLTHEKVLA